MRTLLARDGGALHLAARGDPAPPVASSYLLTMPHVLLLHKQRGQGGSWDRVRTGLGPPLVTAEGGAVLHLDSFDRVRMVDDTLRASPEHEKFRAACLESALNAWKALAGALRGGIQGGVLDGDRGTISVGPEKSEKLVLAPSGHPELDGGGPQKMGGAGYFCGCLPSGPSLPSSRRILRDQQPTARYFRCSPVPHQSSAKPSKAAATSSTTVELASPAWSFRLSPCASQPQQPGCSISPGAAGQPTLDFLRPRKSRLGWPAWSFRFFSMLRSRSNQAVQYLQEQLASPHSTSSDGESPAWSFRFSPCFAAAATRLFNISRSSWPAHTRLPPTEKVEIGLASLVLSPFSMLRSRSQPVGSRSHSQIHIALHRPARRLQISASADYSAVQQCFKGEPGSM